MDFAFVAFEVPEKNTTAVVFINEIDAIAPRGERTHCEVKSRIFSELRTLIDENRHCSNVVIIAATNEGNSIDPDLRIFGKGT